jgi:peptidoglycan-N-acetylglucosamine deacetylase
MKRFDLLVFTLILMPLISAMSTAGSWRKVETKYVALTFDDGPRPGTTDDLVKKLEKHKVKATFFVVGERAEQYPEGLQMIVDGGHEVANHSWSHPLLSRISEAEFFSELERTREYLFRITGRSTGLYRPPGSTRAVLNKLTPPSGYAMVLWDVHSQDHLGIPKEKIIRNVLAQTKDGDVVLLHNGLPNTTAAMDDIIPQLKRQGFKFVTISELLEQKGAMGAVITSPVFAQQLE